MDYKKTISIHFSFVSIVGVVSTIEPVLFFTNNIFYLYDNPGHIK